jgi:hypothetical protein
MDKVELDYLRMMARDKPSYTIGSGTLHKLLDFVEEQAKRLNEMIKDAPRKIAAARERQWSLEEVAASMRKRAARVVNYREPSRFRDGTIERDTIEAQIRALPLLDERTVRDEPVPDPAKQTTLCNKNPLGARSHFYSGHCLGLAGMDTIWSVGVTPEEAIRALCAARLGEFGEDMTPLELTTGFTWGFRFTADGTGCKAAGIHVPGGVVLTWWK